MNEYTPMMQHYISIKEAHPDALIFYRLGDFYELFLDDAIVASKELDLTLTGRNAGLEDRVPMCGVPHHAATSYIQRLANKGYKVAIVEQLEDPALAKGLVKRDVIRIITPGTFVDENIDEKISVYISAIHDYQYGYSVIVADISTGETKAYLLNKEDSELIQFFKTRNIKEAVVNTELFNSKQAKEWEKYAGVAISLCEKTELEARYKKLIENINDIRIETSFALLTNYLEATQKQSIDNLEPVTIDQSNEYLLMDYSTRTNLELTSNLKTVSGNITLWSFLDHCRSAMGSRLLKKMIEAPLVNEAEINKRLDSISYLNENFFIKDDLKNHLDNVYDLERLVSRISMGSLNARDCQRLEKTLQSAPQILKIYADMGIYDEYKSAWDGEDALELIKGIFVEEPPIYTNEGGMFIDGYDQTLDELRSIKKNGKKWLLEFESKERERTGIKNLKVVYSRNFGYCIEISKGNINLIKEEWGYTRKQTLSNNERYVTEELKTKEDELLHAEERAIKLENELFNEILNQLKTKIVKLQSLAKLLSFTDAIYSLAVASDNKGYVRPVFNTNRDLEIIEGRHPILEAINKETKYIANSTKMLDGTDIEIITGPNMGGKSTYMRQTALIIVMSQIGCYVPAKKANMPIFDKIFTRIGASDDLLSGQSTFMVEMNEANRALRRATKNSFILFDEIGRGTATYDGMALAQSIIEYISTCINAKTMFSTHYHELTNLAETIDSIKNVHVDVYEKNEEITFLYKIKDGAADKSYGINVAKLAKLPDSLLSRAKVLLKEFEKNGETNNIQSQMIMIEKTPEFLEQIQKLLNQCEPNNMTPIEALQMVITLKTMVKEGSCEQN